MISSSVCVKPWCQYLVEDDDGCWFCERVQIGSIGVFNLPVIKSINSIETPPPGCPRVFEHGVASVNIDKKENK